LQSTTVSVLTGLTPPTRGDCVVFGRSIAKELGEVRQMIGVCPQTNVLFPSLTVREHLFFFARVKGVAGGNYKAMEKAVSSVVAEVCS
jgi:ATP-binding cassette, subfamily A (ABC1), member 3